MKNIFIRILMLVFLFVPLFLFAQETHSYKPDSGYVPDEVTAIKIAEAVLEPIYGQQVIDEEKPFKA